MGGTAIVSALEATTAQLQSSRGCRKLVEEEIDGGNLSIPSNDKIGSSVNRWLARSARDPWNSATVACDLGLGSRKILEVRMSCFDFTSDAIDLIMTTESAEIGVVENAVTIKEFFDGRTPTGCVVLPEDLLEIADE